jgi:hypothetical protein
VPDGFTRTLQPGQDVVVGFSPRAALFYEPDGASINTNNTQSLATTAAAI